MGFRLSAGKLESTAYMLTPASRKKQEAALLRAKEEALAMLRSASLLLGHTDETIIRVDYAFSNQDTISAEVTGNVPKTNYDEAATYSAGKAKIDTLTEQAYDAINSPDSTLGRIDAVSSQLPSNTREADLEAVVQQGVNNGELTLHVLAPLQTAEMLKQKAIDKGKHELQQYVTEISDILGQEGKPFTPSAKNAAEGILQGETSRVVRRTAGFFYDKFSTDSPEMGMAADVITQSIGINPTPDADDYLFKALAEENAGRWQDAMNSALEARRVIGKNPQDSDKKIYALSTLIKATGKLAESTPKSYGTISHPALSRAADAINQGDYMTATEQLQEVNSGSPTNEIAAKANLLSAKLELEKSEHFGRKPNIQIESKLLAAYQALPGKEPLEMLNAFYKTNPEI